MSTPSSSLRNRILSVLDRLEVATKNMVPPAATSIVAEYGRDPFLVLISTILSVRTKDTVSLPASQRLFALARTPAQMRKVPLPLIEKTIYPVLYYRIKASNIVATCNKLMGDFDGKVPSDERELLSLPGVGRKIMNLVRAEGFGLQAICVDVHVHRISNRLGWVETETPEETEKVLRQIVPPERWRDLNRLLVTWGQNICVPISPFCSKCAVADLCPRIGVEKER